MGEHGRPGAGHRKPARERAYTCALDHQCRNAARNRPGTRRRTDSWSNSESLMKGRLRATARFLNEKLGWGRIGFALSMTIIVIAAAVLYRTLHDINPHELVAALKSIPLRNIL